jgi:hypothetical protein
MKTKIKIKIKYILNNNLYFKYLIIFLNVYPIYLIDRLKFYVEIEIFITIFEKKYTIDVKNNETIDNIILKFP